MTTQMTALLPVAAPHSHAQDPTAMSLLLYGDGLMNSLAQNPKLLFMWLLASGATSGC
ncbi:hypothetical protein QO006_003013 [Deinococcus enclensis]|uniref:Uncharacterized protein n=1 Tax=Deinococcus enclensis TaxID=1049582 RepID=A0ABT9MG34_9DEIO|nr:hypothetical protein [Deinococcus enclensis]